MAALLYLQMKEEGRNDWIPFSPHPSLPSCSISVPLGSPPRVPARSPSAPFAPDPGHSPQPPPRPRPGRAILPRSSGFQTSSLIKSGSGRHPGMLLLMTHADDGGATGNGREQGTRGLTSWGRGAQTGGWAKTHRLSLPCQIAAALKPQFICLETPLNANPAENFGVVRPSTQGVGGLGVAL